jgi:hypothetical protein
VTGKRHNQRQSRPGHPRTSQSQLALTTITLAFRGAAQTEASQSSLTLSSRTMHDALRATTRLDVNLWSPLWRHARHRRELTRTCTVSLIARHPSSCWVSAAALVSDVRAQATDGECERSAWTASRLRSRHPSSMSQKPPHSCLPPHCLGSTSLAIPCISAAPSHSRLASHGPGRVHSYRRLQRCLRITANRVLCSSKRRSSCASRNPRGTKL